MKNKNILLSGFSIIEVMIGIFVFSLWLVAIFALLSSSLNVNELNKNSIIAGQLAREQIELVRNIRDTNYKKLKVWNQHNPSDVLTKNNLIDETIQADKVFLPGHYYFVENDYLSWDISVDLLWTSIDEGASHLSTMRNQFGLCFDTLNRYIKCTASNAKDTKFFKYVKVEQAKDEWDADIEDAYIISSKIIWYKRGYHELEIKTIITDWRRI